LLPHIRARVDAESLPLNEAVKLGVFCEPDVGTIDYPSFARSLEAVNFDGWATVEQDILSDDLEAPRQSARRSRDYLRTLGL